MGVPPMGSEMTGRPARSSPGETPGPPGPPGPRSQ